MALCVHLESEVETDVELEQIQEVKLHLFPAVCILPWSATSLETDVDIEGQAQASHCSNWGTDCSDVEEEDAMEKLKTVLQGTSLGSAPSVVNMAELSSPALANLPAAQEQRGFTTKIHWDDFTESTDVQSLVGANEDPAQPQPVSRPGTELQLPPSTGVAEHPPIFEPENCHMPQQPPDGESGATSPSCMVSGGAPGMGALAAPRGSCLLEHQGPPSGGARTPRKLYCHEIEAEHWAVEAKPTPSPLPEPWSPRRTSVHGAQPPRIPAAAADPVSPMTHESSDAGGRCRRSLEPSRQSRSAWRPATRVRRPIPHPPVRRLFAPSEAPFDACLAIGSWAHEPPCKPLKRRGHSRPIRHPE
jgi:hypothetical protein